MTDETAVRVSFRRQAEWCDKMGSPFTAHLCRVLAHYLSDDTEIGRAILGWEGGPDPVDDALALRVAGALHALAANHHRPDLANVYPPNPPPDDTRLWRIAEKAMLEEPELFKEYLASPPQTNEVGRSGALMPGLLVIAQQFGLPLRLFEIGSSAGLNQIPDQFGYRFGPMSYGPQDARVQLAPEWTGGLPPLDAPLVVASRSGVDQSPIDIHSTAAQDRLLSYVWAGQPERTQRLKGALATAIDADVRVERGDAAEWVQRNITIKPEAGVTRVLYHSVVWQYLAPATATHIRSHMENAGAEARTDAPLAWLRLEKMENGKGHSLDLTTWPNGEHRRLAIAHAHGAWVEWLA